MTSHPSTPIPYAPAVEFVPPDEPEDVQRVMAALEKLLQRSHAQSGHFRGDVHVKIHGCAVAQFQVLSALPAELAQGLFARARTYSAVVRFTNSASQLQSDVLPDGRGLAIKVFDVEGEQLASSPDGERAQDFVMVNHPVFIARNVKDYLRLEQVLVTSNDNPLTAAAQALSGGNWNPLHWHWREAVTVAQIASHLPVHPANNTYYSMAPIRFGQYVAKYRVQPVESMPGSWTDLAIKLGTKADAMRLILEETLRTQSLAFEFQVQLRTSIDTMPVEDATIEWPEQQSPYRTVARLTIPRQELDVAETKANCPTLAFNVWNALQDHQPLGGINRLRRAVYPISAAWRRREQNPQEG